MEQAGVSCWCWTVLGEIWTPSEPRRGREYGICGSHNLGAGPLCLRIVQRPSRRQRLYNHGANNCQYTKVRMTVPERDSKKCYCNEDPLTLESFTISAISWRVLQHR